MKPIHHLLMLRACLFAAGGAVFIGTPCLAADTGSPTNILTITSEEYVINALSDKVSETQMNTAISDATTTKVDKVASATAGNIATLNTDGGLIDGGIAVDNVVKTTDNQTIDGIKTFNSIPMIPTAALPTAQ